MSLLVEYMQEFGRFQRNARLYLISNALNGISIGMVLVLYNLYLVSLGYKADFIGLVLFIGTIGAGIAIFPAGVCVDRFSGKAIILWSSLLIGMAALGQFLFRQPFPLLASAFLAGIGGAFILVVNAPFLTTHSTPQERSLLFSLNIVLVLITTVLGEIIGGALPVWFRSIPWLMARLPAGAAWLLASQSVPRSYQLALLFAGIVAGPSLIPIFLMEHDRPAKRSDPVLAQVDQAAQHGRPDWRQQTLATLARLQSPGGWRAMLGSALLALVAVQVLIGLGAGLFIPYFNIYFVQHLGASSALFGLIDGAANALNAVLTLVAPWLALRIGKVNTIAVTRLLSIPVMLVVGLTSILPLAAVFYPLRQGMMDMSAGILQVFSMEAVPRQHRGLANSSYQAAFQIAWALTAPIGGLIIANLGFAPVFIGAAILYLLAIALLWGRFGWHRNGDEIESSDEHTGAELLTKQSL
ncbi:MAG TPA: MFS transporter [Ktedonosporobacter sp.]|jgi:MFS family permease|nr:MFS transporter [Ktedonosporobacter sp.]